METNKLTPTNLLWQSLQHGGLTTFRQRAIALLLFMLFIGEYTVAQNAAPRRAEELISDQVVRQKEIDNGGSGRYKAIIVSEKTLPDFTVYRPRSVQGAARREGPLPILIWCNGACSGSSMGYERMLNEIASHGYLVVGIGAFKMTSDEREDGTSDEKMVVEAINWLVKQEKLTTSHYYHAINVKNIALSGHSCGGAQAIANCANSRVKTLLIMNAGMGGMSMGGASPQSLQSLHCPLIYMTGGPDDVAYGNAQTDFNSISKVPVTWADLPTAGHGGTYWNEGGGEFGKVALKWLDWRMKGYSQNARLFLKPELKAFPSWKISHRNYGSDDCDAPFLPMETVTQTVFDRSEAGESFAFGADVTMFTQLVKQGRVFYNQSGQKKALMPLLKEQGMNSVRLRMLVNPSDGIANPNYIRGVCVQAKTQNFGIMLDINYSDAWANSGTQTKPSGWAKHDTEQLLQDVYDHTSTMVRRIQTSGADLRWVQIGNEVDNGILWEDGRYKDNAETFFAMMKNAYNAVKEVDPNIQVVLHVGECLTTDWLTNYFDALQEAGVKWDIIGLSAYPKFSTLKPANFITRVIENVTALQERYNTPVMVVETGYYNDRPLEANNFLCDFIKALLEVHAAGLFYWEPEIYEDYDMGAWNFLTDQPSIALDAFLGVRHLDPSDMTGINKHPADTPISISTKGQTITVRSASAIRQVRIYATDGRRLAEVEGQGRKQLDIDMGRKTRRATLLVQILTDEGAQTKHILLRK